MCPCGSGSSFDACCGPLVRNERAAEGVEALMRSRYTAYVLRDLNHLFRTWHPRTRPDDLAPEEGLTWTGLEVIDVTEDQVTFRAHWSYAGKTGVLYERSTFVRRAGRWVYLEGVPL